jgi:hypothetical protein
LRAAAAGIDRDALSDRVSALREGREADEQHEHDAREADRLRSRELDQEHDNDVSRDSGHDYGR